MSHHSSGFHEGGHHFKGLNGSESPGGHTNIGMSQQSLLGPKPDPLSTGDEGF